MKSRVFYNRVESREYFLSTADIKEAIVEYLAKRYGGALKPPVGARQELELDLGDCHDEAAKLTQRFIYDDEPQPVDAVDPHDGSTHD